MEYNVHSICRLIEIHFLACKCIWYIHSLFLDPEADIKGPPHQYLHTHTHISTCTCIH